MISQIKDLTVNEFRIRYKNSKFGYLWNLLTPLLMLITLYIIFSLVFKLDVPHYQLFLLIGIIYWNFTSEATIFTMNSMVAKAPIFTRTNFPPFAIVLSSVLTSFINLIINLIIFFILAFLLNLPLNPTLLLLPLYLAEIFILVLGIALFLCALYPKFRDLLHIWNIIILVGFWISPIVYRETLIPKEYLRYYMLNPIARIINETRDIIIFNYLPSLEQMLITIIIIIAIFFIGYFTFRKYAQTFSEEL